MCCFAQSVKSVDKTKIFARLTDRKTQYLAYQMRYESSVPNAMILPLPVRLPARDDSLRFVDLSEHGDFFRQLARGFPRVRSHVLPTNSRSGGADIDTLRVHRVGNFIATFVPAISDFERLDPAFTIPSETWKKIPHYSDYGFAVFQLQELAGEPHPMAFEFKTRSGETFFPTVHIHDGEVHAREKFDHQLFLQHAGYDSVVSGYRDRDVADAKTGLVRSKEVASQFCDVDRAKGLVAPDLFVHKTSLQGRLPNRDFTFLAMGSPVVRHFSIRRFDWRWPAATLALSAAWFVSRRAKIRGRNRHDEALSDL